MKTICIVTHSLDHFHYLMEEYSMKTKKVERVNDTKFVINGTTYIYVNRAQQLRGLRNYEIQFEGLFHHLDGLDEIEKEYRYELLRRSHE